MRIVIAIEYRFSQDDQTPIAGRLRYAAF